MDAQKLAEDHWLYIEGVLKAHGQPEGLVAIAKHHYVTAFVHGFKHGVEDVIGNDDDPKDYYYDPAQGPYIDEDVYIMVAQPGFPPDKSVVSTEAVFGGGS